MKQWKAISVAALIGALAGGFGMSGLPAFADLSFSSYWGQLSQNGQSVSKVPEVSYNGTSYISIYYLNQMLKKDGINPSWDGKNLQLANVPVQQQTGLAVSSPAATSPVLSGTDSVVLNGQTYVPLNAVQGLLKSSNADISVTESVYGNNGNGNPGSKDSKNSKDSSSSSSSDKQSIDSQGQASTMQSNDGKGSSGNQASTSGQGTTTSTASGDQKDSGSTRSTQNQTPTKGGDN